MIRNQSGQSISAQMIDATTGAAFTGAVSVHVTGDNGSQAIGSVGGGLCVHEGNGNHSYTPSAAETDYALIGFTFVGVGAIPVSIPVITDAFVRNQAGQVIASGMVDATTGAAFTGAVTCYVTGDAGTQTIGSVGAGLCTHKGNGYHTYTPSAAETNFSSIAFTFVGTGAIPRSMQVTTILAGQTIVGGSTGPVAVSSQLLVTGALELIGVIGDGETPTYAQLLTGHRRLNMMLGSWTLQPRTLLVTEREVFDMTAGKGSPSNPYTIGPGGDLDTERPVAIKHAATLLTTSTPNVETPLTVYTDAMYEGIPVKGLSNGMAAGVYLQPTSPLARLYVYQVPDIATNDLVLYLQKPLAFFATLTTTYDLPDGAEEAIESNLAVRLCPAFSVPVPPDVAALARSSLSILKRSTYQLVDLPSPFGRGRFYDIYAGE